jgi:general secretion pathway protein A
MYLSFFGLNEKPFAITPDPRYLYLSERHAEALAHLLYGINEAGGFVQLTGEVGTGKTTVVRSLLAQTPKNAEIALILNPKMTAPEFLLTICEELGIGVPDAATESLKDLVDILSGYLLRAHAGGRRVVVVVDEAQNLAPTVLEQVRLLTNLETNTRKLLQIILIGQPELRELLARNELRQLAQRITGRYQRRNRGVCKTSPARSGRDERHLFSGRALGSASPRRWCATRHQCCLRSRAARRLFDGSASSDSESRSQCRLRSVWKALYTALAALGRHERGGRLVGSHGRVVVEFQTVDVRFAHGSGDWRAHGGAQGSRD